MLHVVMLSLRIDYSWFTCYDNMVVEMGKWFYSSGNGEICKKGGGSSRDTFWNEHHLDAQSIAHHFFFFCLSFFLIFLLFASLHQVVFLWIWGDIILMIIFLMLSQQVWFCQRKKAGNKEFLKKDHLALELIEEKSFPNRITECSRMQL